MKSAFNGVGLVAGIALTCFDFATSYLGIKSLLPADSKGMMATLLPLALAGLALAMNAGCSRMIAMFRRAKEIEKETNFGLMLLFGSWCICIAFDVLTSMVGFICIFTGTERMTDALATADGMQIIAGIVTATLVTIGPFLTGVFWDLIKEDGGFLSGLFNIFE